MGRRVWRTGWISRNTHGQFSDERKGYSASLPFSMRLKPSLPQELQSRFELGFERRAPTLSPTQRSLSATMSIEFFKAALLLVLQAEEDERRLLVGELKTALRRYLEPLLG